MELLVHKLVHWTARVCITISLVKNILTSDETTVFNFPSWKEVVHGSSSFTFAILCVIRTLTQIFQRIHRVRQFAWYSYLPCLDHIKFNFLNVCKYLLYLHLCTPFPCLLYVHLCIYYFCFLHLTFVNKFCFHVRQVKL